jgi:hypothetical protein
VLAPSGTVANTLADAAFYYKLSDTSDASGGGNTLTNNNSVTFNTGKLGNAAYLTSASSQSLSHADATAYNMSGTNFTLACWAYAATLSTFRGLISKFKDSSNLEYYLFYGGASTWRFSIANAAGLQDTLDWAGTAPSTATWYWIVAEKDTANNLITLNVNNGTASSTASTKLVNHLTDAPFAIGARNTTSAFWDGRLDSVCGFKRLWTTTEKATMYNAGAGSDPV